MGNYHARCGAGEKPEVVTSEVYLSLLTQNVEDLLRTSEGQTILSTSDFSLILTQAPLDRAALAKMYGISPTQQEYITNAGPGEGLIRTSKTIVPFVNHYPTDNELYKIFTTKPNDSEGLHTEGV